MSLFAQMQVSLLPMLLLIAVWVLLVHRQAGAAGRGVFGVGKSKAREFQGGSVQVRFVDVAGVEEAKEEVAELVD